jgi:hypothetical protein
LATIEPMECDTMSTLAAPVRCSRPLTSVASFWALISIEAVSL